MLGTSALGAGLQTSPADGPQVSRSLDEAGASGTARLMRSGDLGRRGRRGRETRRSACEGERRESAQATRLFMAAVAGETIKGFHVAHEACRILRRTRSDFELGGDIRSAGAD